MRKVSVSDIGFDDSSQMGIVILQDEKTQKVIPIWIGILETQAIILKMKDVPIERPMTHDLLKNTIEKLGGTISNVSIRDLKNNTYYAEILIRAGGADITLDARPSDAIALALRSGSSILIDDKLMEKSYDAKDFEEKQKSEMFKQILEKIDPKEIPKA